MFLCSECGYLFEEPRHIIERHGQDSPPYEEFVACPYCVSVSFHEALTCDGCGEYITGRYVEVPNGDKYCDECYTIRDASDG